MLRTNLSALHNPLSGVRPHLSFSEIGSGLKFATESVLYVDARGGKRRTVSLVHEVGVGTRDSNVGLRLIRSPQ